MLALLKLCWSGNEDDYVVVSLVRSNSIGFLKESRWINVMLSRCKKGMIICTNRRFIQGKARSLVGKLAQSFGSKTWVDCASSFARRVPTVCMTSTVSNTVTLSHNIIVLFAWFTFNHIPLQLVVPCESVTVGEWVTDNGAHLGQRSLYLEAAGGPNYVLPSIYVLWTSFLLPVSALTTWLQTNKHQ